MWKELEGEEIENVRKEECISPYVSSPERTEGKERKKEFRKMGL